MDPQIQYARTSDGENIAYWDMGEGVPILIPPLAMPWSHVQLEWQMPEWRDWYELLAQNARLIRLDLRGMGLSSGEAPRPDDPEAVLNDLVAVMDKVGLEQVAVFGCFYSSPIAIGFAARFPERVSHLMLWCGFARFEEGRDTEVGNAIQTLMDTNYELFTETLAHSVFGWAQGDPAHNLALFMQRSMPLEKLRRYWAMGIELDVEDLVPLIKAKTLVLHRRDFPFVSVEVAQRLAATISNSRLVLLEGASLSPFTEIERTDDLVREFLSDHPLARPSSVRAPEPARASPPAAEFRTIMFTDITGSTSLTQRLGDARAQKIVNAHDNIVRDALRRFDGTEIKHTGDGIMASFTTASTALESAIAIQRAVDARTRDLPDADGLSVHIGVNAGEPVAEGSDLFGTSVQLARRICDHASENEILVADVVRQLAAGKNFLFAERGETALRGFEDPVRVYELRWRES